MMTSRVRSHLFTLALSCMFAGLVNAAALDSIALRAFSLRLSAASSCPPLPGGAYYRRFMARQATHQPLRPWGMRGFASALKGQHPPSLRNLLAAPQPLGIGGVQTPSTTVWKGKGMGKERLDVENPNPGRCPGQIHYHASDNTKYYYDPATQHFARPSKRLQQLERDAGFQKALRKGLSYLGLPPSEAPHSLERSLPAPAKVR